jgi:hypothetical protein
MMAYLISKKIPDDEIKKVWSIDYCSPGEVIDGKLAFYVQSDKLLSPMGVNVAACGKEQQADSLVARLGGVKLDWYGVQRLVKQKWYPETPPKKNATKKKIPPKSTTRTSPKT